MTKQSLKHRKRTLVGELHADANAFFQKGDLRAAESKYSQAIGKAEVQNARHSSGNPGPVLLTKNPPGDLDAKQRAKQNKALEDFLQKTGQKSRMNPASKWAYKRLHVLYTNRFG